MEELVIDVRGQISPEIVRAWLYALALAPARIVPLLVVMPVFARVGLTGFLRSAIALAMAIIVIPAIAAQVAAEPPGGLILVGLMIKETFIGLIIALAFGVIFWGFEAAGNVLDFQRGATVAIDTVNPDQTTVSGSLFGVIFGTYFILAGGLITALGVVYDSHRIWPVLEFMPEFSDATVDFFLSFLDRILALGVVVAGPIMIVMFASELTLALLTRIAPQLNVFILALGVKSALMLLMLPIYLVFLIDRFGQEIEGLETVNELLQGILS